MQLVRHIILAAIFGAIYLAAVPIFLGAFALDLLLSWRGARLADPTGRDLSE